MADPWLEFADPVEQPKTPVQKASTPPADQFASFAEPTDSADVVDTSQTQEGFDLPLEDETLSRLSPEDEAEYIRILSEEPIDRAGDLARRFLASKGMQAGPPADGNKDFADSIEQSLAYRQQHGVVNKATEYQRPQPTESISEQPGAGMAAARGLADVPTMGFMDELYGVAQALKSPSGHGFEHDMNAAIDRYRGAVDSDEKEHMPSRIIGQLFGGLGIPLAYEGTAAKAFIPAAREAITSGVSREAAQAAGRQAAAAAVRNAMIRDGAYIGGAHGVGSGEGVRGRIGEGVLETGLGAAGGAVTGVVGEVVAPRLAARVAARRAAPKTEEQQLLEAADRQGIDVLPADIGGPVTRRMSSAVSQTIAGGRPIKLAAERMTEQAKAARDRIASSIGQALEPEAAGQQGISGAQKYIVESGREARKFYSSAEKASAGVKVPTPKAVAVLGDHIAALEETPGSAPGLSVLQGIHDALLDGKASVAGIRRMRTVLRDQFIKDGLVGSDLERRVNQVIDAASEDVRDGLSAAGKPEVAADFAAGDAAWKTRARTIDTIIKPLIGTREHPKSGEQVIKTLTADLQGNNARAIAFLKSLPDEEGANVRASIIGAMGKAKPGQQGSEGTDFSLNTFLTNWNQVGERAKAAYFGPEARAALNDLAKVAEGTREAQGYRNLSNTGGVVAGLATAATGFGGFPLLMKTLATQYGLGRLLASPRFARWLGRAPKAKNPQAFVGKLSAIARSEPAIAADVLSLQQRLTEAFSTAPAKLAATSDNEDSEQKPQ